jgi:RimJ/RimL family protein N-acetyltransferase
MKIELRPVGAADLGAIFEWQHDPVANERAAVTPRDRLAFDVHWAKVLADDVVTKRIVLADGSAVGFIVVFESDGKLELGYWIDRSFWGRGIASTAVRLVLAIDLRRPLHAGIALHNTASLRVVARHGFVRVADIDLTSPGTGRPVPGGFFRLD